MARFSTIYALSNSQAALDFVDIDTSRDTPLYLDPYAIQIRADEWSAICGDHIRSFFNEVLDALRNGNDTRTTHLLSNLHEPNETCLGESIGEPQGRAIGPAKARQLADAIRHSRAFRTGILADIAESELFIRGIGPDTISDLTTNVIRGPLAQYTLAQCELHGVPTSPVGSIGPIWNIQNRDWQSSTLQLPVANRKPILLVPKFSVRLTLSLNSQEFYTHHMVEFLRQEHLHAGSGLVKTMRDGTPYVTKKSVENVNPFIKDNLAAFVRDHPEVLEAYKRLKGSQGALNAEEIQRFFDEKAFARVLIERLRTIPAGNANATQYHSIAMGICTFLFYPHLICPVKELEIHQGRKRLDISFTNSAIIGFFQSRSISAQTRAARVMIECKNYTKEINNPELDQLAGRFGHQRGFFGMLLCRAIEDRPRLVERCRDTANDGRGFMLAFEDADLIAMLSMVERDSRSSIDHFLNERFGEIIH